MIIEYQGELMRQNKLLESVINSLSDGILIINEHMVILRATPKVTDWFGVKGTNIVGKEIFEFIQFEDNNINLNRMNTKDVFIKHTPTKNFVISSIKLTIDDNKKRYILIIKDVTNEREIETLKEDFVATLTHDLKVPIVAESNILDFLLNGKFGAINEKQTVALKNMQISNKELLNLVQIVLETYKIKDGGIKLRKENILLNGFIDEIIEETTPFANDAGLKVNFVKDRNIKVTADAMKLERVIKNLINNAIYHSNTKKDIDIKIGEIPGFITISVIDYGQGISQKDLGLIFNKYYTASKKFRKIGTGLGLYLSQQIILAHGGEITVNSEENVRTEFCIKLPL
jgi:signal transduction histidine kinase